MVARLSAADGYKTCGDLPLDLLAVDGIFRRLRLNDSRSDVLVSLEPSEGRT